MNVNFPCRLPVLALLFVIGTLPFLSLAQNIPPSIAQTERINLRAGEMFEIMAVSDFPDPQVSWVLASQQSFIQAGRERVFAVRLPLAGTYLLDANITIPERSLSIRRIFELVVAPPDGLPPPSPAPGTFVQIDPPLSGGSVALPPERVALKLVPGEGLPTTGVFLDADGLVDSDGDGNTQNDRDTQNSFFTSHGTPLHLWLATGRPEITLVAHAEAGTLQEIRVRLGVSGAVPSQSMGPIGVEKQDDGSIAFSLSLSEQERSQVLLEWSFGDGQQSYQMRPIHRYAKPGDYSVAVTVRDLATGNVTRQERQTLTIVEESATSSSSAASTSSVATSAPTERPTDESGFSLVLLLKLLGVLAGSIIVGGLIMWFVLKLRGIRLSQTIETMEEKMTKKPSAPSAPANVIDVAPPPLMMRRTEAKEPEEEVPEQKPAPKQEGPLPPWLQSTPSSSAPKQQEKTPEPPRPISASIPVPDSTMPQPPRMTPEPITPPVEKTPEPPPLPTKLAAAPKPVPTPGAGTGPVPPWLATSAGSTPPPPPPTPPAAPSPLKVTPPAITEPPKPVTPIVEPLPKVPAVIVEPPKPAIKPEPSPSTPSPSPSTSPTVSAAEQEKLDRERERKRRKRQRYRENLRKRLEQQAAGALPTAAAPTPTVGEEENFAQESLPDEPSSPASDANPTPSSSPEEDNDTDAPLFQVRAESIEEENGNNMNQK